MYVNKKILLVRTVIYVCEWHDAEYLVKSDFYAIGNAD